MEENILICKLFMELWSGRRAWRALKHTCTQSHNKAAGMLKWFKSAGEREDLMGFAIVIIIIIIPVVLHCAQCTECGWM